jgi:hypothetical protein
MTTASLAGSIEAFLDRYEYVDCREIGHPWQTQQREWKVEGTGSQRVYTKTRWCPTCDTIRVDRMNARLESLHPVYHYPTDYKADPGQPISRIDVRRWEILKMEAAQNTPTPAGRTKKKPPAAGSTRRRKAAP